jgi:hypothetical protein
MIRSRCCTWSNARTVSKIMNPARSAPAAGPSSAAVTGTGSNQAAASYPRYPTAPPVNRGSSGTYGDRKSAISFRSVGISGSADSVVTPARSMEVPAAVARSTRNGSFPKNE